MRLACPELRLDSLPIAGVKLNLNCRDEIIPILRALQHVYENDEIRRELLRLVGRDVNQERSRKLGRRGLNYWEITVLAAARLGCNLDYDKLQDLAENHRSLRQIMGIGDWQEDIDFDWRRIEDNVTKLRPETIKKISALIVQAGHELDPQAIAVVRGDTFVVETNVHYPTESTLIGDGLRKILGLAAKLAAEHKLKGWRQHEHLQGKVRKLVRTIGRVSRAKGGGDRLKSGYKQLLEVAQDLLARARQLLRDLAFGVPDQALSVEQLRNAAAPAEREKLLFHYLSLTAKVCDNARRRVLHGETLTNDEKILSIFEPHTELIKRGKQPVPIQYGHNVLVIEDVAGFVIEHRVVDDGVLDQDLVVPVMRRLQKRFHGKIQSASFDRAFHTPENQQELAAIVPTPCIAAKGAEQGRQQYQEGTVAFRKARQHHPGVESGIGALQAGNGMKRCRDKSKRGFDAMSPWASWDATCKRSASCCWHVTRRTAKQRKASASVPPARSPPQIPDANIVPASAVSARAACNTKKRRDPVTTALSQVCYRPVTGAAGRQNGDFPTDTNYFSLCPLWRTLVNNPG